MARAAARLPLLRLSLFKVRSFRASVIGGFVTRRGIGGLPFPLPFLYQLGLGLPPRESGLLMIPTAAAAMGMKCMSSRILRRHGFRRILIVNTFTLGRTIGLFSLGTSSTPLAMIVLPALAQRSFNSLQFSSMSAMACADIGHADSSMATSIASTFRQMSLSFGLACGALVAGWHLGNLPQIEQAVVTNALHQTLVTVGALTLLSSLAFWTLRSDDGGNVIRGNRTRATGTDGSGAV
jgi:hypothetical protein